MIISKIENAEQANKIFINPLINSYYFPDTKRHVMPHDSYTNDCIINGKFEELRNAFEDIENYESIISQYFSDAEYSSEVPQTGITERPEVKQYIYPYSRTHLFKNVYTFVLPSLVNFYFQYMKETNRFIQIGTGAGKALYFKPIPFSEEEFKNINFDTVNYNEVVKLMAKVVSQYSQQTADIEYLISLVENHEKVNQDLLNQLQQVESNWMTSINYTWR